MKYLLDTDTCIFALKGNPRVLETLLSQRRADVAVSVITEAELRTGAAKSATPGQTLMRIERFLRPVQIIPFDSDDAVAYADVRAALEKAGTPFGPLDTLIAAQAVRRGLILVTNNQREFSRVRGLNLENWAE